MSGASMAERRLDFLSRYDWIRTSLCFEPRGHDMMSGGFLYPPTLPDADAGILFIETSGCLPMCGHGTIGMVTFGLEHGLIQPATPGKLRVEVPAGVIEIAYETNGPKVTSVRITNVPAYVAERGIEVDVEGIGPLSIDVSYGGNYYAIVEPQGNYTGLDDLGASRIVELSGRIREAVRAKYEPVHPLDSTIRGVSHILWADKPKHEGADGRNAVFYGDKAIDRSPCGTGTSARLAHLHAKGRLKVTELTYSFGVRQSGDSKLDNKVLMDFLGLIVAKATGGLVSLRFLSFATVGAAGLVVHLAALRIGLGLALSFLVAQAIATMTAMTFNYLLNNLLTYRDRRLTGFAFLRGLLAFYAICGLGAAANVGAADWAFYQTNQWWLAGIAGAFIGAVWNYAMSRALVWKDAA
ncbi:MAG: 4-hydroxyproline epimerase [Starkeya sp.]|nr:4-hydroxyproline epimerase [Starkeya sp.]